jgi:hypothetical protein
MVQTASPKGRKAARTARTQSPASPHSSTPPVDHGARALALVDPDDRVLTFQEFCAVNRFSTDTGRRVIAAGDVDVIHLSKRRIGITVGANRAFHEKRTRKHHGGV